MSRTGGGVYVLPATYAATSGETIEAQQHNDPLEDLEQDANSARPIVAGGTGETTAIGASDAFSTKGSNVASATTTDIGASSGRYVHITGTTTITGFGNKTAGVIRFLTFDGILTLTHNATSLILPGAANITTAANDTAVMVSEGSGNWRCVSYQSGIIKKAVAAEVYAATADKYLDAALIEGASALVAMTDSATPALDWDAGINRSLTISQASAIQNPTNGQPGTYRTILVQGNDATDRTITFGNQFLGDVPTITDCDSTKWYLLTIRCITASHFCVTSIVAKKP